MPHTKKNSKSISELNNNVDLTESVIWSLLEKRIGEDFNTLETVSSSVLSSSSGLSSSDTLESNDIFQTFIIKSSNFEHPTSPNVSELN